MRCGRAGALGVGVLVLAVSTAGCGSPTVSRAAYARAVCTSISAFEEALALHAGQLRASALDAADDPASVRTAAVSQLTASARAADVLARDLSAAGVPTGGGGKDLARALAEAGRAAARDLQAQADTLQGAQLGDRDLFSAQLDTVGNAVQQIGDRLGQGLNATSHLGDRGIGDAFAAEPRCRGL